MSEGLHKRLEARIGELRAAGCTIASIVASPEAIQQIFVEAGDSAILLDCDPGRDAAWYGDIELRVSPDPGAWLLAVDAEHGQRRIEI